MSLTPWTAFSGSAGAGIPNPPFTFSYGPTPLQDGAGGVALITAATAFSDAGIEIGGNAYVDGDFDAYFDLTFAQIAAEQYFRFTFRQLNPSSDVFIIQYRVDNGQLELERFISSVFTQLAVTTVSLSSSSDVMHWRVRCLGSHLKAKVWLNGAGEPGSWNAWDLTDTNFTTAAYFLWTNRSGSAATARTATLSGMSVSAPAASVPSTVDRVNSQGWPSQIEVTWPVPDSDGESPVTGYTVDVSTNGGSTWTNIATPTTRRYSHTGLTNGSPYRYRVAPVNAVGTGSYTTQTVDTYPQAAPSTSTGPINDFPVTARRYSRVRATRAWNRTTEFAQMVASLVLGTQTSSGTTITPGTVAAVASIPAPTVTTSATAAPGTVAAVAAVPAPTIGTGTTVTPGTVAAVASIPAPTVQTSSTSTPGTVVAVATIPAPVEHATATLTPATVGAVASIPSPTIQASATPTAATVTAVASIPSPAVTTSAAPAPGTVAAVAAIPAPQAHTSSTVTPGTISAVASIPAPVIAAGTNPQPGTIGAIGSVPAPTVTSGAVLAVATVAAIAGIPAPTVVASGRPAPSTVVAVAAIPSPTLGASSMVQAGTIAAVASLPAPFLFATALLLAGTVTARASIPGVHVDTGFVIIIPGVATLTISAPSAEFGMSAPTVTISFDTPSATLNIGA